MPGAGKQPPEMQEQIRTLLEAGFDPTTIHRRLKVGRSSIYRMKRCLQRHGTYVVSNVLEALCRDIVADELFPLMTVPPELNKKNGRPKVLTAEQELEVRDWLRQPNNRSCYLDDLVWLLHDRFGIVCSTTTMSKLKRKWLRVIEYEETGRPLDEATRVALRETHPDLVVGMPEGVTDEQGEGVLVGAMGTAQMLDPAMQASSVLSDGQQVAMGDVFALQPGLGEVERRMETELGVPGPAGA